MTEGKQAMIDLGLSDLDRWLEEKRQENPDLMQKRYSTQQRRNNDSIGQHRHPPCGLHLPQQADQAPLVRPLPSRRRADGF